jgi:hypothetical protein
MTTLMVASPLPADILQMEDAAAIVCARPPAHERRHDVTPTPSATTPVRPRRSPALRPFEEAANVRAARPQNGQGRTATEPARGRTDAQTGARHNGSRGDRGKLAH